MRETKARKKILEFLENTHKAFTAKEIHGQIDDIDLATVYRNLNLFAEMGIVRELKIIKGESLYEINKDNHQHAVCNVCGKVEHIEIDSQEILKNIRIKGFKVEDIEITIKGHCKN